MLSAVAQGEVTGKCAADVVSSRSAMPRAWWLACLCLALLGLVPTARASGVYRCLGAAGQPIFTSQPAAYSHCKPIAVNPQKAISRYTGPRSGKSGVVLRGSVYRVERADGSVEYTNVKPRHGRAHKVTRLFNYIDSCYACALRSTIDWHTVPLHLTAYHDAVSAAAEASGVQPAFLRAIIHAESGFNPQAMSDKGAQGLMQLMPATASSMGVADAFDATQNIEGGARYLAELLKQFHGNRKLAAAAYNAGP
ncbi:MAG TPA: transglycosylase SLT domain-containing protein, partial [Rhodanobacteraceae bacterium]